MEWLSIVRCGRASVLRLQGDLEKAQLDLDWAKANGPRHLQPRVIYEQAKVYWAENNLEKAYQQLVACEELSQDIGDRNHDYRSFVDMLDLVWEFEEYSRWRELSDKHNAVYIQREGEEEVRLRGSCWRKLGDLAICDGDYETALEFYTNGYTLIAESEVHKLYTIGSQIRKTDKRISSCKSGQVLMGKLGTDLADFWQNRPNLVTKYPETLITFHRWQRQGAKYA